MITASFFSVGGLVLVSHRLTTGRRLFKCAKDSGRYQDSGRYPSHGLNRPTENPPKNTKPPATQKRVAKGNSSHLHFCAILGAVSAPTAAKNRENRPRPSPLRPWRTRRLALLAQLVCVHDFLSTLGLQLPHRKIQTHGIDH